ncbi:NAD(+) synthase [Alkaliphilus peptidifermentans]|uniref:NH(3)-dependent NAD(+) synthetase n=1 Tax=Alkaliphilus peptidifermentans DSM 18978 TaxID=1120976 RepID=A0A1G5DR68_9FIRM|nr:NAD(+) synthase [Alkaliphilus peptidifermentans]SCY17216.1 NH(3)-dependent NAD(+) synthetase [Alkaliphilus peptidifermentans DSM 18978]
MSIERKIEKVVAWLQQKVEESGTKGIVVGISGGIDSAVVANLIKKAFPENSLGVILPIKSSPKDVIDGRLVAEKAGIKNMTIDLTQEHSEMLSKIFDSLLQQNLFEEKNRRITDANLRARLRMTTLYGIANQLNYLVAGTDNAAEVYTGYFTKYGDGGVDILPIATLKKYEVYEWAKALGVPKEVLDREPSAGLWEGQTDEEEMGTTYSLIDAHLEGKEIPKKDLEIIERLHRISEHKRVMPPFPEI